MSDRAPLVLIHGGLAESMDANRFWVEPGVVAGLQGRGFPVAAPDRDTTPASWAAAATHLAADLDRPHVVLAGSNGVSVALRMAIDHAPVVERLLLLWPATAGDPEADGAVAAEGHHLLAGDTIRGVRDAELALLRIPTAVMASEPENLFHQHRTVDRLLDLLPDAHRSGPGTPEPTHHDFAPHLRRLLDLITEAAGAGPAGSVR